MAVRIRLKRVGRTHTAAYRVVVVNSREKRDGRVIEGLGIYDPQPNPSKIRIDSDHAQYRLGMGAQPPDQIRNLLVLTGSIAKPNGKADAISHVGVSETGKAVATTETMKAVKAGAEKSKAGKTAVKAEEKAKAAAEASAEEATEAGEET